MLILDSEEIEHTIPERRLRDLHIQLQVCSFVEMLDSR
jgi:hypothetical protein